MNTLSVLLKRTQNNRGKNSNAQNLSI